MDPGTQARVLGHIKYKHGQLGCIGCILHLFFFLVTLKSAGADVMIF